MKIKNLMLVPVLALALSACSGAKEETIKCKMDNVNGFSVNYTYGVKGDKVTKIKMDQNYDLSAASLTEETFNSSIEKFKKQYDFPGMSYKPSLKDGKVNELIEIDMSKADIKDLISVGIVTSVDGKTPKFISFKETKKSIETMGVKCDK